MPLQADQTLIVLLMFAALIVILLVAWRVNVSRQISEQPPVVGPNERELAEARIDEGEREAELIAEQIESMVQNRLAQEGGVVSSTLDFGTEEDGSLAIWYQGTKYTSVEMIPETKIRQAVQQAVEDFNKRSGDE